MKYPIDLQYLKLDQTPQIQLILHKSSSIPSLPSVPRCTRMSIQIETGCRNCLDYQVRQHL